MSAAVAGAETRSLHSIAPGERARIATILFDKLRLECAQLGLNAGERIVCRAATPAWLILETRDGRRVRLERGWARFMEIADVEPAGERPSEPGARAAQAERSAATPPESRARAGKAERSAAVRGVARASADRPVSPAANPAARSLTSA